MSNFTTYRSSAGSGKTHTLVKEYIRLALGSANVYRFGKILAITFTNKAAEEMKERVIQNLYVLQLPNTHAKFNQNYLDEIAAFCELAPHEVQSRAQKVFKTILHNYHLLKITTIDKFTVSLVYSFARDLDIDADHEIVTDVDEVIDAGVRRLIDQSGKEKELTDMFVDFLGREMEEGNRFNVRNELKKFCAKVLDEKGYEALEAASACSEEEFFAAYRKASAELAAIDKTVKRHSTAIQQLLAQAGITAADMHYKGTGVWSWFKKVEKEGFEAIVYSPRVKDFMDGKRLGKDAGPEVKQAFAGIEDELVNHVSQLLAHKRTHNTQYLVDNVVKQNAFSMALFKRLHEAIREYKTTNSVILLSEFTKLVSDIVAGEPAPFIYEKLGERVKNIFVDEFQDTSAMQFANLVPLMENSLATNDFVMLVGDAKQSIYRWRNGHVEQFINLPALPENTIAQHPYRQSVFESHFAEKNLPVNYRSLPQVVEFNNLFFKALLQLPELNVEQIQLAYKDVAQEVPAGKAGGYVAFEVNYTKPGTEPDETTKETEEDTTLETAYTLRAIDTCLQNGYAYGDIAVLVRQHRDGEAVFAALRKKGIPVVSNQALGLAHAIEIKTMVSFFMALQPNAALTHVKQFALNLARLQHKLIEYESHIQGLQGPGTGAALISILDTFKVPFYATTFRALNLFEQMHYLAACLNISTSNAFVSTYFELVFEFFRKNGSNSAMFINWWQAHAHSFKLQTGDSAGSVKIVTIHKSKGLQYPVVIMPFLNWEIKKSDKYFWLYDVPGYDIKPLPVPYNSRLDETEWKQQHELEHSRSVFDAVNMLYVALTRAEHQLFCFVNAARKTGVTRLITSVLDALAGQDQTTAFSMGTPVVKGNKPGDISDANAAVLPRDAGAFMPWYKKLMVSTHFISQHIDQNEAQRKGILIHEMVSRISHAPGVDKALARFYREGRISAAERDEIRTSLQAFYDSPTYAQLSAQQVQQLSEVELTDGQGRVYRPDLVIVYAGKACAVVDIKTGDEEETHPHQVTRYANLLAAAGYTVQSGWLYYFKTNRWKNVYPH